MPESWENDPDWWKGEASEGEEGFEGTSFAFKIFFI